MPDKARDRVSERGSLSFYHSATQLRFDTWHQLEQYTRRLTDKRQGKERIARLRASVERALAMLETVEQYSAFPSKDDFRYLWNLFRQEEHAPLARIVARIVRALSSHTYRSRTIQLTRSLVSDESEEERELLEAAAHAVAPHRPYFEVLIVDEITAEEERALKEGFRNIRRPEDRFVYDVVVVPSFEDALIAVMFNYNIQVVVIRYGFPFRSNNRLEILQRYLAGIEDIESSGQTDIDPGPQLGAVLGDLRPELDMYLVTDVAVEAIAGSVTQKFKRIFYRQEDYLELHLSILRGIEARYQTPFFSALREFSRRPTGVFHAMPISRGKSVVKSHWIQDMAEFYGVNVFLAETSATSGGLDSLLQPHGPIKKAQELAARAFGARQTYFVTNGTSTANKIVVQALLRPGDIALIDRDCHKSHHYAMVLSGAHVAYLDAYPLHAFSMYGAVPLASIKRTLLEFRRAGKLHRVRVLLLTNCTFDGIVYNVERVMEECLAIKPDLVFVWDEAWFAFAYFTPIYRQRTAMGAARRLLEKYRSAAYRKQYAAFKAAFDERDPDDDGTWLDTRLMPDPDAVRLRVYATQSTHKSLTALRQGSMIHIFDQDFKQKTAEPFNEAFMTHTSTSPNYQILASLDVGRRQVELEGFELVQKQLELAMALRERVASNPRLNRHFRFLVAGDMVPEEFRPARIHSYYDAESGWANYNMEEAWAVDDFVVDPTRLTLYLGPTGIDGNTFKTEYLMDRYGIQINKTSRNTVLFMTNIGTTRSSVAYLIGVLAKIAHELERQHEERSPVERRLQGARVRSLTEDVPPLPDFSHFHHHFSPGAATGTPEGDIRTPFFMAYEESLCEYLRMDDGSIDRELAAARDLVSASFIIPYPPGFPILVPGQVISEDILRFMRALDVKEIHGYEPELGLRVFTAEALAGAGASQSAC